MDFVIEVLSKLNLYMRSKKFFPSPRPNLDLLVYQFWEISIAAPVKFSNINYRFKGIGVFERAYFLDGPLAHLPSDAL